MANENSEKILTEIGIKDESIKAILAFAQAQNNVADALSEIAENTTKLVEYFRGKDGFTKELRELIENDVQKKIKEQTKDLTIKFFSIIGTVLLFAVAVFTYINNSHMNTIIEAIKKFFENKP